MSTNNFEQKEEEKENSWQGISFYDERAAVAAGVAVVAVGVAVVAAGVAVAVSAGESVRLLFRSD